MTVSEDYSENDKIENNKNIIKNILKNIDDAQSLNFFFSNIVTNLENPEYSDNNSNSKNIINLIMNTIFIYSNHPSILTIKEVRKERSRSHFPFLEVY